MTLSALAQAQQVLPVFLADNHAETAGWITRNFDLDASHVLVLVDAHSDATAAERSDEMREKMRRVPTEKEREIRIQNWRKVGRLQAFNWIEPLMPRPLDQVLWLAAPVLDEKERAVRSQTAVASLDGRLEVEPRSAASFARRWETCDLNGFEKWQAGRRKVILAMDLDFFAGMEAGKRKEIFEKIWERAMDWPGLEGVAFAVSRPWLKDDAEAEALISLAINAVRHTRGARLEIDASIDDRPDDSLKAAELNHLVPRWDLAKVSSGVRASLGMIDLPPAISDRSRKWNPADWSDEFGGTRIVPEHGEIDCDEVWRFQLGNEPVVKVRAPSDATGRTRWFMLESSRNAYDFLPETGLGKSFSNSPARWIYQKRRTLGETSDFQLGPAKWHREQGGRFIIEAEVETSRGWLPVPPIDIRILTGEGFHGSLSECMGMPYVFGIAGIRAGDLSGVESGWGSDCANLLIHAWRRNGIPLDWGDPGRLRTQLDSKASELRLSDAIMITADEIARGIAIDFGSHVAAVWEDRAPFGLLDGNDLVIHHLGGRPEIIELAKLSEARPVFSVLIPRVRKPCHVAFAGDVVLASDDRVVVDHFTKGNADAFVVNLEGIPSLRPPNRKLTYDFRFPPDRLDWLKSQGVDAVSLANNHAADAGAEGIIEGIAALDRAGILSFGAGKDEAAACHPLRMTRNGVRMAIFGISYFDIGAAGPNHAGVAVLPNHRDILEAEFRKSREAGEQIIAVVHGGNEYESSVDEEQRSWARWLAARGVRFVVGSHPHVIQREEFHAGTHILHSFGNAVYPQELKGADSGEVRILAIGPATAQSH